MRIALIGAAGQLGSDLLPRLMADGHDVEPLEHSHIDITDVAQSAIILLAAFPDLVINCAAYNLVDKAEDEPEKAHLVNALGARNLAGLCEDNGCRLLHVSSDYVFGGITSGRTEPLSELDLPAPNSVYSVSKLAGEYFVRSKCSRSYVVRTCGLYGTAALRGQGKGNFVETMLRLGKDRKQLKIVGDQHCTPTSTVDLADALARLVATDAFGLYHATNSGSMTWCEFAREIFRLAKLEVEVLPITTAEFGAKARRPGFSVLDCGKLASVIGGPLPDWHEALAKYLAR